jgi:hypothetical protein
MPRCPGCRKSFSRLGGYSNHLQQTQKSACRAVLARAVGEWLSESSDDADTGPYSDTPVANHLDFNFEDFNFEGHDDEEDLMYSANDYGEAPVPEQLEGGMDVDEPENNQEVENDLHQAREVRWAAEEAFRKTPVVEAFPSAEAGAPIADIQALPRYDSYKTCLKNSDNPWDPFSSRLDWEVAYWAKRCGPSATAFTELLRIDGVSTSVNAKCRALYLCIYRFASV